MIIALIAGLILLWCGYKVVKFVTKLIVWGVAVLILLGVFCYYLNIFNTSSKPVHPSAKPSKHKAISGKGISRSGVIQSSSIVD